MGYSFKVDKEQRLVTVSIWEVIDKESVLRFRRDVTADPDFSADFSQLAEYLPNTKLNITSQEVDELRSGDPFSPAARRAFVAHTDVLFGYARMYAILMESNGYDKIKIFRNMDEAVIWIGGKE